MCQNQQSSEQRLPSQDSDGSDVYSEGVMGGVLSPAYGAAVATGDDDVMEPGAWSRTPGHVMLYDRGEHLVDVPTDHLTTIAESLSFSLGCVHESFWNLLEDS